MNFQELRISYDIAREARETIQRIATEYKDEFPPMFANTYSDLLKLMLWIDDEILKTIKGTQEPGEPGTQEPRHEEPRNRVPGAWNPGTQEPGEPGEGI
mgnify:CR=1 FL=1